MSGGNTAIVYDKPVPRDPRSPDDAARIRGQNRRREYLHRHPSYYKSLDHEMAGKHAHLDPVY